MGTSFVYKLDTALYITDVWQLTSIKVSKNFPRTLLQFFLISILSVRQPNFRGSLKIKTWRLYFDWHSQIFKTPKRPFMLLFV